MEKLLSLASGLLGMAWQGRVLCQAVSGGQGWWSWRLRVCPCQRTSCQTCPCSWGTLPPWNRRHRRGHRCFYRHCNKLGSHQSTAPCPLPVASAGTGGRGRQGWQILKGKTDIEWLSVMCVKLIFLCTTMGCKVYLLLFVTVKLFNVWLWFGNWDTL